MSVFYKNIAMRGRVGHRGPARMVGLVLSILLLLVLGYFQAPTLGFDFAGIYVVLLIATTTSSAWPTP